LSEAFAQRLGLKGTVTMENPTAFYAIALHAPELRETISRATPPTRRVERHALVGVRVRSAIAHALRAIAARVETAEPAAASRLEAAR
jgi:hypothetical protein